MKINIEKRHLYILIGLIILASVGYVIAQTPGVSHHPDEISPQGAGSGLDADMVDGLHANQIGGGGSMSCYEYTVRQGGSTLAAIPSNVVEECTYNCYFTLSAWLEEGSGGGPHHWVINSGTVSTNVDNRVNVDTLWTSVNIGADTYGNWHGTEMADGVNSNGASEIIADLSVCNFRDGESATSDEGNGWSLSWTTGTSGEYCVLTLCPT